MKQRLIVGLTGSFGSGKSTVAKLLKQLGRCKVIDSDKLAHEVFKPGHPIGRKIKKLFGIRGALNRRAVADQVFANRHKRKQLEALVHPYVFRRIHSELKKVKSGIVVLEIPLLFETGFERFCDLTVSVFTPERDVLARLVRKGYKSKDVRARFRAQLSGNEKRKKAHLYIQNSGSKKELIQKVKLVLEQLKSQKSK